MADGQIIIDIIARTDGVEQGVTKATGALSKLNSSTGAAEKQSADFEDQLSKTAKAEEKLADATSKTTKADKDQTSQTKKATQARKDKTDATEEDTEAEKENNAENEKSGGIFTALAEKVDKAKEGFEKLEKPVKSISKMMGPITGMLGAMGVTTGITELINAFKEMAKSADAARDAYHKTKTELIQYTGELSEAQEDMVNAIYEKSSTNTGFTDKEQVTKAVAASGTLWKDGSDAQQQAIAAKLTTLQALGRIGDTATYATEAKGAFTEWGVGVEEATGKLEYLYYISQQTGVDMESMTQTLSQYGEQFKALGYTMDEAAQLIGNSFNKYGDTKKLTEALDQYETNYEDKLQDLTDAWQETHEDMELPDSVLKKFEEQAEEWATDQARAYGDTLKNSILQEQEDALSSEDAWKLAVRKSPEISAAIGEATQSNKDAANPTSTFDLQSRYGGEAQAVIDELEVYGDKVNWFTDKDMWLSKLASNIGSGGTETLGEVLDEINAYYSDNPATIPATVKLDDDSLDEISIGESPSTTRSSETATDDTKGLNDQTEKTAKTVGELADNTEDADGALSNLNGTQETTNETSALFRDTLAEVNTNLIGLSTESTNAATTLSSVFDVQINTTIGWLNAMAEALRTVIALQSQVE